MGSDISHNVPQGSALPLYFAPFGARTSPHSQYPVASPESVASRHVPAASLSRSSPHREGPARFRRVHGECRARFTMLPSHHLCRACPSLVPLCPRCAEQCARIEIFPHANVANTPPASSRSRRSQCSTFAPDAPYPRNCAAPLYKYRRTPAPPVRG